MPPRLPTLRLALPPRAALSPCIAHTHFQRPLQFQLQLRLYAAKPKSPPKPTPRAFKASKPSPASPQSTRQQPQSYVPPQESYALSLASYPGPTLLYTYPASSNYQATCYTVSAACLAYGTYHITDHVLVAHPGLWVGVSIAFAGVGVIMVALGSWIGLSARRLVQRIEAIPHTRAGGGRGVLLRLRAKGLFRDGEVVDVDPAHCTLAENPAEASPGSDWKTGRAMTHAEWAAAQEVTGGMKRGVSGFLGEFGRIWSREGLVGLRVREGRGKGVWKVDVRGQVSPGLARLVEYERR